jgi:hypothetical protein
MSCAPPNAKRTFGRSVIFWFLASCSVSTSSARTVRLFPVVAIRRVSSAVPQPSSPSDGLPEQQWSVPPLLSGVLPGQLSKVQV